MSDGLTRDETTRAVDLVRQFYTDELAKRVRDADQAQRRVMDAVRALEGFNGTCRLAEAYDSLTIAVWTGSRALRATADEMRGALTGTETDAAHDDRLLVLRWMAEQGYDIGSGFKEEIVAAAWRRKRT